jgi:beta-mannosidase
MLKQLDLNGTWRARWSDGMRGRAEYADREETDEARYIDAQVPGEIHLDVWKQGWIKDPYVGTNCLAARWVEECIWSYRRFFRVPGAALKARAWLHFEGLDLAATIVLNGAEIGRHTNSFHPCRIEVTGKLKAGRNLLTVHLDGGLYHAAEKPVEGWGVGLDARLHKRHWLRKPQCQFGWDWSTRLINIGITKPVRLEWTVDPVRIDAFVPLADLSADLKTGTVRGRLFVEGLSGKACRGKLTVAIVEAGQKTTVDVELKPGLNPVEASLRVTNPELWWPVGHGAQKRYTVRVSLSVDGRRIGEKTARIGFRHVRINQDKHPEKGRYFVVEVNGRKIFVKGGNFVPMDMIFPRADRKRYDKATDLALEANFNLLRIWGGGLYESDDFYDLCDQKGILVWQEFIFACAKYPVQDEAFHNSVKEEARFNIRRLAPHPSLVVWCGNNEMEWGAWSWGYDRGAVYSDYALFHLTIPRLLAEEDPGRYYQPSSPFSPDGLHPNADEAGDQHPWTVGFQNTDFRDYRRMTSRFPNEGGTLGPTSLPTMLACLPAGQRHVQSFAWQVHDNSIDSWGEPSFPDQMITQWLGKDIRKMGIEEFTYWGGLLQGEALREYCENFRRRMFDSASAIFWMYNDCWPATRSWTIVDYYLRRTPAFAAVRRAMQPLHVVVAEEGNHVAVFGVNERAEPWSGTLRCGLFNLAGGLPLDRTLQVTLPPNASTRLASFSRREWKNPAASAAFAMLAQGDTVVARNRLFLPFFKDLKWAVPHLRVRLADGKAIFSSDTFVWGVCLDLDGARRMPDNFFDVYPGIPHVIPWQGTRKPKVRFVGNLKK